MTTATITEAFNARRTVKPAPVLEDQRPEPPDESRPLPPWVRRLQAWEPRKALGRQRVEIVQAVEGLIRAGKVGALVAAGGTGKTTMLLILGICHATGRPFFGQQVIRGSFVLLSNDDPQEDLEMALEMVVQALKLTEDEIAQVSHCVRLHSLQGEPGIKAFTESSGGAVSPTGLEELIVAAVENVPDLVGIAIDTLRQFSGGSSNDEQVVKVTIAGATEVAMRTGAYVILPHHTGKQNYRDGVADLYCGSGSAAIADNCRFVLLLQTTTWPDIEAKVRRTGSERGDPLVLTSTRGSLLMKPTAPIFLHRDGYFMGRVSGASLTVGQQFDERDRKVLRAVSRGAQFKNAIYAVVKGKKTDVLNRVDDLESRGHLMQCGSQRGSPIYVLTESGRRFPEADDAPV